jgi:hypothetical protein
VADLIGHGLAVEEGWYRRRHNHGEPVLKSV